MTENEPVATWITEGNEFLEESGLMDDINSLIDDLKTLQRHGVLDEFKLSGACDDRKLKKYLEKIDTNQAVGGKGAGNAGRETAMS